MHLLLTVKAEQYTCVLWQKIRLVLRVYIRGPEKNKFIDLYVNKDMLINAGFPIFPYTTNHGITLDIVYLPSKELCCTFSTNGSSYYNTHIVPKIENFPFRVNKLENKNNLD